jgi:hypothetical protein
MRKWPKFMKKIIRDVSDIVCINIMRFIFIVVSLWSTITYLASKARLEAIRKPEELESELHHEIPSFVKAMLHSHVVRGFWLVSTQLSFALPSNF